MTDRLLAPILLGCLVAACAAPKPFLLDGDADGAEVGYAADPATTLSIAAAFCARYERVPRLLQLQENVAYYQCHKP
jgi:hypothetical protein